MTELIVISDSHGNSELVRQIIRENPQADYYIHCGDLCDDPNGFDRLISVKGNCDYYDAPYERVLTFDEVNFLVTHSHRYPAVNRLYMLTDSALLHECDFVFYGHTHVPSDDYIGKIRLLNPGSLMYNRDGSALSYLLVQINAKDDVEIYRKFLQK